MKIVRLIFILAAISILFSRADALSIYSQGCDEISGYSENSSITGDDLTVGISFYYDLSIECSKYNSGSFEIRPWHGNWHENVTGFGYNIIRSNDCSKLILPNCTSENCTITLDVKFKPTEETHLDAGGKIDSVKVNLNILSHTETCHNFHVTINYTIPKFIEHQGSHQIAWFKHDIAQSNQFTVSVTLPSKSSIIERIPDTAELKDRQNGKWVVELKQAGNNQIWFTDVDDTEKWTPLKWALVGAIAGFGLELLLADRIKKYVPVICKNFVHLYVKLLKNSK